MKPPGSRREWILGLVGLWSALTLLPAVSGRCAEPRRPNLQGTWNLNPQLTAQLMKDQQEPGRSDGRQGGGMGRHGRGGGGGGGQRGGGGPHGDGDPGGGSPPGAQGRDAGEGRQGGMLAALESLTIAQTDGQVTVTDQGGRSRVFKTDGSKVRDEASPGGPAQVQASWDKDGTLVVEVKPEKGSKRTESYVVADDRKHLYLTLTLGQSAKILRAYDLAPDQKSAP